MMPVRRNASASAPERTAPYPRGSLFLAGAIAFTVAAASEEVREGLYKSIPFPSRFGQPDEFAAFVESVLSNPYLNGETIRLDGAVRMH